MVILISDNSFKHRLQTRPSKKTNQACLAFNKIYYFWEYSNFSSIIKGKVNQILYFFAFAAFSSDSKTAFTLASTS